MLGLTLASVVSGLLGLLLLVTTPGLARAREARIEVVDDRVSARLDAVPVVDAMTALRRAANLEVVLPGSVLGKTVTLSVEGVPLEGFIRRLLERLDVGGYALVYEPAGATRRLIVVESGPPGPPAGTATPPPVAAPAAGELVPPVPVALGVPPTHKPPVVRVEALGVSVNLDGRYDRLDLVVTGPDGRSHRRQHPWGSPAYFDVRDERGQPLRDGRYNYEVVVVPELSEGVKQLMDAARESQDERTQLHERLREEGWLSRSSLTQSGTFSVRNGLITVGGEREAGARRP